MNNNAQFNGEVKDYFFPGENIILTFANTNFSSTIHDLDEKANSLIISQNSRNEAFTKFYKEKKSIILTTELKKHKTRIGIEARISEIINNYKLSSNQIDLSAKVFYEPKIFYSSMRDTNRIEIIPEVKISGLMKYKNLIYKSTLDFKFKDISISGIGILVKRNSPLLDLQKSDEIKMRIGFPTPDNEKNVYIMNFTGNIARVDRINYVIGLRLPLFKPGIEQIYSRFLRQTELTYRKKL